MTDVSYYHAATAFPGPRRPPRGPGRARRYRNDVTSLLLRQHQCDFVAVTGPIPAGRDESAGTRETDVTAGKGSPRVRAGRSQPPGPRTLDQGHGAGRERPGIHPAR